MLCASNTGRRHLHAVWYSAAGRHLNLMADGGLQPEALAPSAVPLCRGLLRQSFCLQRAGVTCSCCPETPVRLLALMIMGLPCLDPTGRSPTEKELLNGRLPPPGHGSVLSLSVRVAC